MKQAKGWKSSRIEPLCIQISLVFWINIISHVVSGRNLFMLMFIKVTFIRGLFKKFYSSFDGRYAER